MEFNAAQSAALVLVTATVTTLRASYASEGWDVVSNPYLVEVVNEEFIVAPRDRFLMVSDSASLRSLIQFCM